MFAPSYCFDYLLEIVLFRLHIKIQPVFGYTTAQSELNFDACDKLFNYYPRLFWKNRFRLHLQDSVKFKSADEMLICRSKRQSSVC